MAINISGLFLIFCYQQQEVKREMKQYLGRNLQHAAVTVFAFSLQDQKNIARESDDEFTFQGRMYDVIKTVKQGDKTIVYCMSDAKETALVKNFFQHNEQQAPLKAKTCIQTEWLSWPYLIAERNTALHFASLKLLHHPRYTIFLPYAAQAILVPPPRRVC